jgi:CRP/FNR family cyclic AMP-dependent transcriptional regulator
MDKDGIKTLMKEIPRFNELDEKEIDLMASYLDYRQEPDESVIIKEGEIGDNIFYIVSGEAKVSVQLPAGSDSTLIMLGKGEVVGEMAILSLNNKRSASVTSVSEIELLILSKKNYERLVETHNRIAFKILESITSSLCERIKQQSDQLVFLSLIG